MPPLRKVSREDVISVVLELLKTKDMNSINARMIASYLNCSVQPIFYNFKNMEELKTSVFNEVYNIYQEYMIEGKKHDMPYKGMGLAYIKFARDYPNYFRIIYMNKTDLTPDDIIENDNFGNDVIQAGQELTSFSFEEQKKFHLKVWIFTHGLACMVATSSLDITDEKIDELLESAVRSMIIGEKKGNL